MSPNKVLVTVFTAAFWASVNVKTYINGRFRVVLDSDGTTAALFSLASVMFCPGLLEVVQSVSTLPLSWFESLSLVNPKNVLGVYILVLKKSGYDPLLYVGSGIAGHSGVKSELYKHGKGILSPVNIAKAREFGYNITHVALLAYYNILSAANVPEIRTFIITLEALFHCGFLSIRSFRK